MHSEIEIGFAPRHRLPEGYKVVWFEGDEHYHWIKDSGKDTEEESCLFSSRWQARHDAILHYKKNTEGGGA